jgi:hypothetical protein
MKDVSAIFDHYRVSARAIWNTVFWPDEDFRNWDSVDQFGEIRRILFSELVLAKLDTDWPLHDIFRIPIPFFRIVPSSQTIPILIQNPRPNAPSGYWDHPVNQVSRGDAEMHFLGYFDWNQLDYLDFRYYHVQIARFDAYAELVGREALVDRQQATVYMENE